jgi:hypothetical protein
MQIKSVIVIPWRPPLDNNAKGHRAVNFTYVRDLYLSLGFHVIVSSDGGKPGEPFNRSRAYNRGLVLADSPDVVIWNEADCIIPEAQLNAGIELCREQPGLVVPYTERIELTLDATQRFRHQGLPFSVETKDIENLFINGSSIGQCGITSAETLSVFGDWDEGFEGWGYDDNASFQTFATKCGPPRWISGASLHLWHPLVMTTQSADGQAVTERNRIRYEQMLS